MVISPEISTDLVAERRSSTASGVTRLGGHRELILGLTGVGKARELAGVDEGIGEAWGVIGVWSSVTQRQRRGQGRAREALQKLRGGLVVAKRCGDGELAKLRPRRQWRASGD